MIPLRRVWLPPHLLKKYRKKNTKAFANQRCGSNRTLQFHKHSTLLGYTIHNKIFPKGHYHAK